MFNTYRLELAPGVTIQEQGDEMGMVSYRKDQSNWENSIDVSGKVAAVTGAAGIPCGTISRGPGKLDVRLTVVGIRVEAAQLVGGAISRNPVAKPGICLNAMAPGFSLTNQHRFLLVDEGTGELTPRGQIIIDHTPMRRSCDSEDLLGTSLWLLSLVASFVTGVVTPMDGGFSAFSGI